MNDVSERIEREAASLRGGTRDPRWAGSRVPTPRRT